MATNFNIDGYLRATGLVGFGNYVGIPPAHFGAPGDSVHEAATPSSQKAAVTVNHSWKSNTFSGTVSGLQYTIGVANTHASNNITFTIHETGATLLSDNVGPINQYIGHLVNMDSYNAAAGFSQYYGFECTQYQITNSNTVARMASLTGCPIVNGSANITQAWCVWAQGVEGLIGAGTITHGGGINCGGAFLRNGYAITNHYGVKVDENTAFFATGIENNYGVWIGDQSAVGSSTALNLYSLGTGSNNVFEGKVTMLTGQLTGVAFSGLPASPVAGMYAYVTDSDTVTWGANIGGGNSNKVLAWYNGTNWTVAGK